MSPESQNPFAIASLVKRDEGVERLGRGGFVQLALEFHQPVRAVLRILGTEFWEFSEFWANSGDTTLNCSQN